MSQNVAGVAQTEMQILHKVPGIRLEELLFLTAFGEL